MPLPDLAMTGTADIQLSLVPSWVAEPPVKLPIKKGPERPPDLDFTESLEPLPATAETSSVSIVTAPPPTHLTAPSAESRGPSNRARELSRRHPAASRLMRSAGRFCVRLSAQSFAAIAVVLLAGCHSPAVRQQRLVSLPNMTFSESAVFAYHPGKLLPQLQPGLAGSGGAQNSGCTSCR
jgi:hypothetical protein